MRGKGSSSGALQGPGIGVGRGRSPKQIPVALTGIGTMRTNSTWKQTQNRGSQTGQEKRGNQPRPRPALHAPLPPPALPRAKGLSNRELQPPPRRPGILSRMGQVTLIWAVGGLYRA